ncbi:MAG: VOC family protein [Halobacteria archaeon]|nr:VOC family protein [Halobacteria archaeon]
MNLSHLALEVKYLEPVHGFYDSLGLENLRRDADESVFDVGNDTRLVLRSPSDVPRGGLHTHYALSTPYDDYDGWYDRVTELTGEEPDERDFGGYSSLYFYDPEGNCVEIGQSDSDNVEDEPELDGVFEVVLEVEDLGTAVSFYEKVGFELSDAGEGERRVRLDGGGVDLELWEPRLGIADGQGGVHVDFGLELENVEPGSVTESVSEEASSVERTERGTRLKDPDGHYLTLSE